MWPWVVQIGQGRGGFYSYDALENLAGSHIHSAAAIVPEWQDVRVGDVVRLHPQLALEVELVDPPHAFVIRSAATTPSASPPPYDFTWAFVLHDTVDGGTRLVVRERYRYTTKSAPLVVEPVSVASFVMTHRMLRGIRTRAERFRVPPHEIVTPGLYLYWIPLGAGAHVVRVSGAIYEALYAFAHREPRKALYHSALVADTGDGRYVIEVTPIPDDRGRAERGVVGEGPVGSRLLARWRVFRYEIRRWRNGTIPDVDYAIESPVKVTDDADTTRTSSTTSPASRRRSGVATSTAPATCGTPTRSCRGCSHARSSSTRRAHHRSVAAHRVGRRVPSGRREGSCPRCSQRHAQDPPAR